MSSKIHSFHLSRAFISLFDVDQHGLLPIIDLYNIMSDPEDSISDEDSHIDTSPNKL